MIKINKKLLNFKEILTLYLYIIKITNNKNSIKKKKNYNKFFLSPIKFQKILFISYAYFLTKYNVKIFDETKVWLWLKGPVFPGYRKLFTFNIKNDVLELQNLNEIEIFNEKKSYGFKSFDIFIKELSEKFKGQIFLIINFIEIIRYLLPIEDNIILENINTFKKKITSKLENNIIVKKQKNIIIKDKEIIENFNIFEEGILNNLTIL